MDPTAFDPCNRSDKLLKKDTRRKKIFLNFLIQSLAFDIGASVTVPEIFHVRVPRLVNGLLFKILKVKMRHHLLLFLRVVKQSQA